jgi:hypothetical protein
MHNIASGSGAESATSGGKVEGAGPHAPQEQTNKQDGAAGASEQEKDKDKEEVEKDDDVMIGAVRGLTRHTGVFSKLRESITAADVT